MELQLQLRLNASDATDKSYTDFSIVAKPEMVEGLEVGYGYGETEVTTGTAIDESAMYSTLMVQ